MTDVSRLRIIAGPNGSGKSTIKAILPPVLLGIYINPDEIEEKIRNSRVLDLKAFGIEASREEVVSFFEKSTLLQKNDLVNVSKDIRLTGTELSFLDVKMNSYFASVIADFIRRKVLEKKESFTFETVMSSRDKIEILDEAKSLGYRVYLYYIATEDPEINISRIRNRVHLKGHSVPDDKVKDRYYRSLGLLIDAIKKSNRAYIFDNSTEGKEKVWLAEITDGQTMEFKNDLVPLWFKTAVLDKIDTH